MKRKRPEFKSAVWAVEITSATEDEHRPSRYNDFTTGSRIRHDQVAVRITRNGEPHLTYGTLYITDERFEDKITSMKAEAQDRASALQAVGVA